MAFYKQISILATQHRTSEKEPSRTPYKAQEDIRAKYKRDVIINYTNKEIVETDTIFKNTIEIPSKRSGCKTRDQKKTGKVETILKKTTRMGSYSP
jgi:hypothetical protein